MHSIASNIYIQASMSLRIGLKNLVAVRRCVSNVRSLGIPSDYTDNKAGLGGKNLEVDVTQVSCNLM